MKTSLGQNVYLNQIIRYARTQLLTVNFADTIAIKNNMVVKYLHKINADKQYLKGSLISIQINVDNSTSIITKNWL